MISLHVEKRQTIKGKVASEQAMRSQIHEPDG